MDTEQYFNKTEEQQFEEAKSWFKQNGSAILLAMLVGASAVFGWNFWKNHNQQISQESSAAYDNVIESYLQDPIKNEPLVEKFIKESEHNSYATFAQFTEAQQLVNKGDFAKAKTVLEQAVNAEDATLQTVARFRLAQVEYQLQNYDAALATLGQIKEKAWTLRKAVLTGDIFVAKGDNAGAKSAYQQALADAPEQEKALIELRLNNL